jgi:hypothetical protein
MLSWDWQKSLIPTSSDHVILDLQVQTIPDKHNMLEIT